MKKRIYTALILVLLCAGAVFGVKAVMAMDAEKVLTLFFAGGGDWPAGTVYLTDSDGAYITDSDGAYITF